MDLIVDCYFRAKNSLESHHCKIENGICSTELKAYLGHGINFAISKGKVEFGVTVIVIGIWRLVKAMLS